jgi:hypothetical protein
MAKDFGFQPQRAYASSYDGQGVDFRQNLFGFCHEVGPVSSVERTIE